MTCLRATGVVKKLNCPLVGSWFLLSLSRLLRFGPKHGLLSEAARGYLYRQEWEKYGRIHASAKRQHLNPSNDGLEFF